MAFLKDERKETKVEALNKSVIETNEVVRKTSESTQRFNDIILPKIYLDQINISKRSFWLAFVSVLFIAISTIVQLSSKTDKSINEFSEQLKRMTNILDSMKNSFNDADTLLKAYYSKPLNKKR